MPQIKISELPLFTGNTSGSYLVMNNSGETTTYKVSTNTLLDELATTGSNIFVGNQTITGSLTALGSASTFSPSVRISGSNTLGELLITNAGRSANAQILVSSLSTSESSKTTHNSKGTGGESSLLLQHESGSVWFVKEQDSFNMFNSFTSPSGSIYSSFFSIANNPSTTNLAEPQFKRSVGITGSLKVTEALNTKPLYYGTGSVYGNDFQKVPGTPGDIRIFQSDGGLYNLAFFTVSGSNSWASL
jgi:hypothetical protein